MDRRTFVSASLIAAPLAARAQGGQPPLRIVFPFAAGGVGDALSRILADEIGRVLGETAFVEARPGAGGQTGTLAVATSAPDGRTLLSTPVAPITILPLIQPNLPYDPFRDLAPISQVGAFDFALGVGPAVQATTLADLAALVRADPRLAVYGSPGAGTLPHFFGLMLGRALSVDLRHVAYRGSAPALTDLVAGQVPMVMSTTSDMVELARAGRIRLLAVSAGARSPFLPDVPTFREAGIDLVGDAWYALYARAGTPAARLEALSRAAMQVLAREEVRARILSFAMVPTGTSSEELARIQRAHQDHWAPIVRASGFRME